MGRTVLILDDDLGFIFALAQELNDRHISAFPARTAREGHSIIRDLRLDPDLLVIDCSSPGACSFAGEVAKESVDVKIVGLVSEHFQCKECAERLVTTFRDPDDGAPDRISYCANVIEALLMNQSDLKGRAGVN